MSDRKKYHLVIRERDGLPACHAISIGGVRRPGGGPRALDFRRVTQVLGATRDDATVTYPGAVGLYTDEEVALFREAVKNFVVRWRWSRDEEHDSRLVAAEIHDVRCVGFEPDAEDEPLEPYLVVRLLAEPLPPIAGDPIAAESVAQAQQAELVARATDAQDERRRARHARAKASDGRIDTGS